MPVSEPLTTALLLTTFGVLLAVSALFSRASERVGLPIVLIFLLIGMAAGAEGIGGIPFDDYAFAFRLGTIALVLILFDGGLNTSVSSLRQFGAPAATLATVGVVGTASLVAVAAHALGFRWELAMLLGAVVAPTDAAAVFSVLRGSGINLKRRVGQTLEVESGLNDPVAVLLTVVLTRHAVAGGGTLSWWIIAEIAREIVVGAAAGAAVGYLARAALARYRLPATGLYPVVTLASAFLAYGLPTILHGSGFLGVYIAAVMIGQANLPFRGSLVRVHDSAAWLGQIAMFLVLGLLIYPSQLVPVAFPGLVLALALAFVARPLVTAVCVAPFGYPVRDVVYIGWVGLRGAVPIVLALFPVLAGVQGAAGLFATVFFIAVASTVLPGMTVPWVTRRLGLESADPPPPPAVLEIDSHRPLRGELESFYVDDALAVAGTRLGDLPFPPGTAATLIVRGDELVAPTAETELAPGDHVYVLLKPEDRPFIHLMFGRPEE